MESKSTPKKILGVTRRQAKDGIYNLKASSSAPNLLPSHLAKRLDAEQEQQPIAAAAQATDSDSVFSSANKWEKEFKNSLIKRALNGDVELLKIILDPITPAEYQELQHLELQAHKEIKNPAEDLEWNKRFAAEFIVRIYQIYKKTFDEIDQLHFKADEDFTRRTMDVEILTREQSKQREADILTNRYLGPSTKAIIYEDLCVKWAEEIAELIEEFKLKSEKYIGFKMSLGVYQHQIKDDETLLCNFPADKDKFLAFWNKQFIALKEKHTLEGKYPAQHPTTIKTRCDLNLQEAKANIEPAVAEKALREFSERLEAKRNLQRIQFNQFVEQYEQFPDEFKELIEQDPRKALDILVTPATLIYGNNANSLIHHAILLQKSEVVRTLVNYGADLFAVNNKNECAFYLAVRQPDSACLKVLWEHINSQPIEHFVAEGTLLKSSENAQKLLQQLREFKTAIDRYVDTRIIKRKELGASGKSERLPSREQEVEICYQLISLISAKFELEVFIANLREIYTKADKGPIRGSELCKIIKKFIDQFNYNPVEVAQLRDLVNQHQKELAEFEVKKNHDINALQAKLEIQSTENANLKEDNTNLKRGNEKLKAELSKAEKDRDDAEKDLDDANQMIVRVKVALDAKNEELKKSQINSEQKIEKLEDENTDLTHKLKKLGDQNKSLKQEVKDLGDKNIALKQKEKKLEDEVLGLTQRMKKVEDENTNFRQEISTLREDFQRFISSCSSPRAGSHSFFNANANRLEQKSDSHNSNNSNISKDGEKLLDEEKQPLNTF